MEHKCITVERLVEIANGSSVTEAEEQHAEECDDCLVTLLGNDKVYPKITPQDLGWKGRA